MKTEQRPEIEQKVKIVQKEEERKIDEAPVGRINQSYNKGRPSFISKVTEQIDRSRAQKNGALLEESCPSFAGSVTDLPRKNLGPSNLAEPAVKIRTPARKKLPQLAFQPKGVVNVVTPVQFSSYTKKEGVERKPTMKEVKKVENESINEEIEAEEEVCEVVDKRQSFLESSDKVRMAGPRIAFIEEEYPI